MDAKSPKKVEERDAVYYPFIHVRDREWLNGTLLYFPHLVRMVPRSYPLQDEPWVSEYAGTAGRLNQPLLQTIDFWQKEIVDAQKSLAVKIQEDIEQEAARYVSRFSQSAANKHPSRDTFRISQDRLIGIGATNELYQVLNENNLIWEAEGEAFGIHPILGEAIMATLATTIAVREGMDVVTPSGPLHDALASRREDTIYEALVREQKSAPPASSELVDELASVIVVGAFDVGRLSAKDIAKLHDSHEDLSAFRAELAECVSDISAKQNRAKREAELIDRAKAALNNWEKRRAKLSNFAKGVFSKDAVDLGKDRTSELLKEAGSAGIAGLAASTVVGQAPGLLVAVAWYAAKRALDVRHEAKKSPYRWLSKIHTAGARLRKEPLWESRVTIPSPDL